MYDYDNRDYEWYTGFLTGFTTAIVIVTVVVLLIVAWSKS